jgi:hypothetical protein
VVTGLRLGVRLALGVRPGVKTVVGCKCAGATVFVGGGGSIETGTREDTVGKTCSGAEVGLAEGAWQEENANNNSRVMGYVRILIFIYQLYTTILEKFYRFLCSPHLK